MLSEVTSPGAGAPIPTYLTDAFVEYYVRWREESIAVKNASASWLENPTSATLACAVYTAALDREEAAAREYALCADYVRRWSALPPSP
jgi:hypothetical protein